MTGIVNTNSNNDFLSPSMVPDKSPESALSSFSLLSSEDIYLFKEGSHFRLYNHLGAHFISSEDAEGTYFSVWAPNAERVSVLGDFNGWNRDAHSLRCREDGSGIWEGVVAEAKKGSLYKFFVVSKVNQYAVEKKDPYAFWCEEPPYTASRVWDLEYDWQDSEWMGCRRDHNSLDAPMSIYEIHLGSWRRHVEEGRFLTYREMADSLVGYVSNLGFSHVEFMPIMEHPFYGSWGYQSLNYFAPTSRYGSPQDLMYLIDELHQSGVGVIMDWVPSHFPTDEHGLSFFDGTCLYEHADSRKGFHPDWKCSIFNNGRNEVKEFLISSAVFWLDKYHVDALRVDGVASMLYLDYSRKDGEWVPNEYGGRDNIESISFLRQLNEYIYKAYPDVHTIAEESTDWANVSRPVSCGGLGFGMKWNMGWMHDTLKYFLRDALHRKYHHNDLTFSMLYAYTENFVLSLSHDEVVHGKKSLLERMPGDEWQKFANMRLLLGYMYGHPGKKLLFMGGEFAQRSEWDHDKSLDWHLLDRAEHLGVQTLVKDLNHIHSYEPALHKKDFSPEGFEWVSLGDWEQSILCFLRKGISRDEDVLVVCNFTPLERYGYRVGVPDAGFWQEILNTDSKDYGGSGVGNLGGVMSDDVGFHNRDFSVSLSIPPLGVVFLKRKV